MVSGHVQSILPLISLRRRKPRLPYYTVLNLKRAKREQVPSSPYVFTTERRGPMTAAGIRKLLTRIGLVADLSVPIHRHMLRHGCGFKLANDGHDTRAIQEWLGHQNVQHTTRYTELTSRRFRTFGQDED